MVALRIENCCLFLELALNSAQIDFNVVFFTSEIAAKISLYYRRALVLFNHTENILEFIVVSKSSLHHNYSLSQSKISAPLYYTSQPSLYLSCSIVLFSFKLSSMVNFVKTIHIGPK